MEIAQLLMTVLETAPTLAGLVALSFVLWKQESRESERVDRLQAQLTKLALRCGELRAELYAKRGGESAPEENLKEQK